ncbi:MAG TPA: DciA family protein [Allosphingosinicella sp.]|nr:DciA family protein [Allosphingosinicella sp.]
MAKSVEASKKRLEAVRANRARAVADIVPDIGRAAFSRFGFVQSSIVSRWPEIVGERYAAVSSPESIRFPPGRRADGVLNLIVEGAHAPMMQHVAPVIMERVNRFFGYQAVARVAIRQGLVQIARARTRAPPASLRPLPAELGDSLREVADPELRACLESLARGVAAHEAALGPSVAIPVLGRIGGETKR